MKSVTGLIVEGVILNRDWAWKVIIMYLCDFGFQFSDLSL